MATIAINHEDAAKADQKGNRIRETGKYFGEIIDAYIGKSSGGATMVEFKFVSDDGLESVFPVYTKSKDGKQLSGGQFVNAIGVIGGFKSVTTAPGVVKRYDYDLKKETERTVEEIKEFRGLPICVVLQKELYTKQGDKSDGDRMVLFAVARTDGFTASEITSRAVKAERLDKMIAMLKDHDGSWKTRDSRDKSSGGSSPKLTEDNDPFGDSMGF